MELLNSLIEYYSFLLAQNKKKLLEKLQVEYTQMLLLLVLSKNWKNRRESWMLHHT